MARYLVPLGIFLALVVFLAVGLNIADRKEDVPSPLINKPAPAFQLPQLLDPQQTLGPADLRGQVYLLNVWASWCASCRDEHPVLVALSRTREVPIYGLDYKDKREDALDWIQKFGNPYTASVMDVSGQVGIDYGVYGVPETYVVDQQGVIRHKHIGPITEAVLKDEILPIVRKLKG